jgi:hypothetical protein
MTAVARDRDPRLGRFTGRSIPADPARERRLGKAS